LLRDTKRLFRVCDPPTPPLPVDSQLTDCNFSFRHEGIEADESWQVEYLPGHFERIHNIRKKYACAGCEHKGSTSWRLNSLAQQSRQAVGVAFLPSVPRHEKVNFSR
jgi:hypothetical protein